MRALMLILALAATGCGNLMADPFTGLPPNTPGPAAPAGEPDIRGVLTSVAHGTGGGTLTIEENPNASSGSAKARLKLTASTIMLRANGQRLSFEELAVGQRIEAWYEGPVAESYPVQADAKGIRLLP